VLAQLASSGTTTSNQYGLCQNGLRAIRGAML
jgi:hypothetical protein